VRPERLGKLKKKKKEKEKSFTSSGLEPAIFHFVAYSSSDYFLAKGGKKYIFFSNFI
jgi:hypothetical protein